MLHSIHYDSEQKAGVLNLLSGKEIVLPLNRSALSRAEWRLRTKELMQEVVYVRPSEAPSQVSRERLQRYGLQHCFYLGNSQWPEDESLFRVALVDETDRLRGFENKKVHDKYSIEYRPDLGYRVIRE